MMKEPHKVHVSWVKWVFLMLLLVLSGCDRQTQTVDPISLTEVSDAIEERDGYGLSAAVLYDSTLADTGWETTMEYLDQSLVVNLSAKTIDVSEQLDLGGVDLVFLDEALLQSDQLEAVVTAVVDYTEQGGYVFLPNGFYEVFPKEYLGAKSFEKVTEFPETLTLPEVSEDLTELQELIEDFHSIYPSFADAETLVGLDYGYGMKPDTAVVLAYWGDVALYTLNNYGQGAVLLCNPLLPNTYSESSFSLRTQEGQTSFSGTTASCNQMILGDYAAYVLKQIYGFSMSRVFGAYGSPAMSWELHYEDITSIENDSLSKFVPILKAYNQVPSISLVRNTYTWFEQAETMTYVLNQSDDGALEFELDRTESAYSSGTHIAAGSQWLQLGALQDCDSYFGDFTSENYRLTPCILDYDGDGNWDAFCGSEDGKVYYFHGQGFSGSDGRLCMDKQVEVAGVSVSSFSAPQLLDLDGDGELDMLVGGDDGCIYWYRGNGTLSFEPQGILLETDIPGQCLLSVGDIDGDGTLDLAVGSDQGILLFYYGKKNGSVTEFSYRRMGSMSRQCADEGYGFWLSPDLIDLDGDGVLDLALGTYDGYVVCFSGDGTGNFSDPQYITVEDMNYKGNNNLKFGHYCTPVFCDLDQNGSLDLLCGYEEYGMAYPIDSDYFPFREELQAQIDDAVENDYYIGVHYMSGNYVSADRESQELSMQLEALASYGLKSLQGVNQHTWRMASQDRTQSLRSIWEAGLLWESGYAPSGATSQVPQQSAENVITLPFFLMDGEERTLLVQNCSVLPYKDESWTDLSGKYGMPVLVYYHCDMIYKSDEAAKTAVAKVAAFQEKFSYNFVKEDQLMYSIAAAYNLTVDVQVTDQGFSITPGVYDIDFPLYDEDAQNAVGIRIDFSAGLQETMGTDAAVWTRSGSSLSLGLDRTVTVFPETEAETTHLSRVNIPAEITLTQSGAVLAFQDSGMEQVAVAGKAETEDEGWTVEEQDGYTIFTAYEKTPVLHITYQ
jgi:hypothetical protein